MYIIIEENYNIFILFLNKHHYLQVGFMPTLALYNFSNLGISVDATALISCSILIFYDTGSLGQQHPGFKRYDIIERNSEPC